MTRYSYIQKLSSFEDMTESCQCPCSSVSSSRKHPRRLFILIMLLASLITAATASSIHESSSLSSIYIQDHLAEVVQNQSNEDDSEPSEEDDDYGSSQLSDEDMRRMYLQQAANYSQVKSTTTTESVHLVLHETKTEAPQVSKCSAGSCLDRQSRENEALNAFKKTLLMKLGMERLPNMTKARKLPDDILAGLCIQNKWPIEYCTGKPSPYRNMEYMSDDPGSYGHEQVIEQEEDVHFMSSENRIYAFPKRESLFTYF